MSDQEVYAMRDNLRRYRVIHDALIQSYPGAPSGRLAQHLITLAAFIRGIVGSKSSQLPSIATKMADRAKLEAASNACREGSTTRTSWSD
jgi:hypothetical protein